MTDEVLDRLARLERLIRIAYDFPMNEVEAADYARVSLTTIRRLRKDRKIAYTALCVDGDGDKTGRILYYKRDIDEALKRRRREIM